MLIEKIRRQIDYTSVEKSIADQILSHPGDFELMTADQLAEAAHVSKASVIRFAKKNGCDGYRSFQRQLIHELESLDSYDQNESETVTSTSRLRDVIDAVPSLYHAEIQRTRSLIDLSVMERVIAAIQKADEVEIYGSGITSALAEEAAYKLRTVGVNAASFTGINEHAVLAGNKKKRIAMMMSFTGHNTGICTIARYLRRQNYTVIGIGGQESDALRHIAHEYITVDSSTPALSLEVLSETAGFLYVIDVLFTALMIRNYSESRKNALLLKTNNEPKDA